MKTALITGGTDGIGLETARQLANKGFQVIITGRNSDRCERASQYINSKVSEAKIRTLCADFTDRKQIENAADFLNNYIRKIDVLINNAGTFETSFQLVENKYEKTFFVNHLTPFYFTYLILDILDCSTSPRIINVSSMAHAYNLPAWETINSKSAYDAYESYSWSKLANILYTFKLSNLLKHKSLTVNCLHPGVINTKLLKAGWGPIGAPLKSGAETPVFLATSDIVKTVSGKYFTNKQVSSPASSAYDSDLQDLLWTYSEEIFDINYSNKVK